MQAKHIPWRTCAGCGTKASKRELVRFVRRESGTVEVDTTGKKAGRGTYLCPRLPCWEAGFRKGRLEHLLRTAIPLEQRQALLAYAQQWLEAAPVT